MTVKIKYIINKIFILFILLSLIQTVECGKFKRRYPRKLAKRNEPSVKVSIIVPTYNVEPYVERCIKYCLNQTLKEIEVIVVDDKSTDKTLEVVNKFSNDKRLKVYALDKNSGPSHARNFGLEKAIGEFVTFIDSDDYIDEKYLEYLYGFSKDYDLVNGTFVDSTNSSNKYTHGHYSDFIYYGVLGKTIWRRSIITENNIRFDEKAKRREDVIFKNVFLSKTSRRYDAPDNGIYYYYKKRLNSYSNIPPNEIEDLNKKLNEGK